LSERWDGAAWTLAPVPAGIAELDAVSCAGPTVSCVAIGVGPGNQPAAARWDGTAWTSLGSFGHKRDDASAISCSSPTDCLVVGSRTTGGFALRWDGTRWHSLTVPHAASLAGVACAAPDACTAVGLDRAHGRPPLVVRWNGTRWKAQADAAPREDYFDAVACPTRTACVAVGSAPEHSSTGAFAERWDGRRWQRANAGFARQSAPFDVDCRAPVDCTMVGNLGQPLAMRWNGGRWTRIATPNVPALPHGLLGDVLGGLFPAYASVACVPAGPCVAVGGQGSANGLRTLAASGP